MTVANYIDTSLIELQIDGAELTEPERVVMIEKLRKTVNQTLLDIGVVGHSLTITCEEGVREYPIRDIQRVDSLIKDGCDLTYCRVTQLSTFSRENRS